MANVANDSYTQQRLAADPNFTLRVAAALSTVAWEVLNEDVATPGHDARASYARAVLGAINSNAASIASWLVARPNLIAFETSYNFPAGAIVTAAGDADITSQLATDWSHLAGVS